MTAASLLAEVRSAGADVAVEAGELVLRGRARVSPELRERLRAARLELLALLAENGREACVGCGRTDWIVSVVMADGDRACARCLRAGGAGRRTP